MLRRIIRRLIKGPKVQVEPPVARPPVEPEPEPDPPPEVEMDTEVLKGWIADEVTFTLLDIRESHELRFGYAEDALRIRMNDIPNRIKELPEKTTRLVVYCAAGSRSYGVAHWLREQGWDDAWSLESGFHGVAEAGLPVTKPES